jgi:hypothetical protein
MGYADVKGIPRSSREVTNHEPGDACVVLATLLQNVNEQSVVEGAPRQRPSAAGKFLHSGS